MTYTQVVGNAITPYTAHNYGRTVIDLNSSANETCTLIKAYCNASNSGSGKIKIFRDDGTDYIFVGEHSISNISGTNIHSINISIQSGDFIGYYFSSINGCITSTSATGNGSYRDGDITTTTPKSGWNTGRTLKADVNAGYDTIITDYYVKTTGNDSLSGTSWANAWKTINKAATTVVDGVTVHIGFGTYDAEPAANKIAPQNIGTSGIYYLPETATTGGGTGTVSVEQNT